MALGHTFDQVVQRAHAARCNHRDVHGVGDGAGQGDVEPGLGPVPIHRGQEDLARALGGDRLGKFYGVDARRFPATMGEDLPPTRLHRLGVDRHHDALAAELIGGLGNDVRVGDGGGVETHFVGSGQKKGADVLTGAHAAAHGQRDIALLGRARDHVIHRAAVFMCCVDVEETDFVGPRRVIGAGAGNRIAGIDEVNEIHPFDHAAIGDVETGDHAGLEHGAGSLCMALACLTTGPAGMQTAAAHADV